MDMKNIKEKLPPGIWGAVAGAAVVAIVGFNWGGWVARSCADEIVS